MSSNPPSSRNIEIKAKVGSNEEFKRRVEIGKKLTGTGGEIIEQHDVFYNVTNGRLKLRYLKVKFLINFDWNKTIFYFFVFLRKVHHN